MWHLYPSAAQRVDLGRVARRVVRVGCYARRPKRREKYLKNIKLESIVARKESSYSGKPDFIEF